VAIYKNSVQIESTGPLMLVRATAFRNNRQTGGLWTNGDQVYCCTRIGSEYMMVIFLR
jgi:hypothetical protein